MKNKFNLKEIAKIGNKVANHCTYGGYTCLYMGWIADYDCRDSYTNLFDFGHHALETIIERSEERYTDQEYKDLRIMLVAMFYEVARRENEGENILPE
jgi:hypothetical protein